MGDAERLATASFVIDDGCPAIPAVEPLMSGMKEMLTPRSMGWLLLDVINANVFYTHTLTCFPH